MTPLSPQDARETFKELEAKLTEFKRLAFKMGSCFAQVGTKDHKHSEYEQACEELTDCERYIRKVFQHLCALDRMPRQKELVRLRKVIKRPLPQEQTMEGME